MQGDGIIHAGESGSSSCTVLRVCVASAKAALILVAERNYPNTDREFVALFPDDRAYTAFLTQLHWPKGFICPARARVSTPWNLRRGRLVYPDCRHQTSVTASTIFDKARTPLTTWLEADLSPVVVPAAM